jgi:hypothetical protein
MTARLLVEGGSAGMAGRLALLGLKLPPSPVATSQSRGGISLEITALHVGMIAAFADESAKEPPSGLSPMGSYSSGPGVSALLGPRGAPGSCSSVG